ncbi:MAG: Thioredoxin reductase [uncultured Solirubrobacteraceae bacterium]|uniref:Thioredoxin reductase n=1 Tax=uncultured Solirubrobacteraceae bacterium TaxID=1162706 RepID=A0A6J4SX63_9ACTN|nr:MAG: Thioredoxin reductase [uncultured Solirubrobacteraceae bacterium]
MQLVDLWLPCHVRSMDTTWDCIVVGAGAAGLSAALVLGRARRRTLVIDAGKQSNRHTAGIGGLLASDRRPPLDFYETGRVELANYPPWSCDPARR